jgi:hypothetical protein
VDNILEKLCAPDRDGNLPHNSSPKDKQIHAHGLISILKQLHDDLDAAVFDAYGWPQSLTDDQLLEKLVALNHQRAAEEKQGIIKYLRPDFQNPTGATKQTQSTFLDTTARTKSPGIAIPAAPNTKKPPFPKYHPDQTKALRDLLADAPPTGLTPADFS